MEGDILLQTPGLRRFPVKILNGTDRQTQPYKTFSTTIWLRGDVLAVSLTKCSPPPLFLFIPPSTSRPPPVSLISVLLKFAGGTMVAAEFLSEHRRLQANLDL